MAKYFSDLSAWQELLAGDFNRGYLAGVGLVIAVVLLLLVIRLVLGFLFRTRRARAIEVNAADGEVLLARDAVISAVDLLLADFPDLMVDAVKIYRRNRNYSLVLHCRFRAESALAFPDLSAKVKEAIFTGLQSRFGVTNLRKIKMVLTELEREGESPAKSVPAVPVPAMVDSQGNL